MQIGRCRLRIFIERRCKFCAAVCERRIGDKHLDWCHLPPILPDGRIVRIAETPFVTEDFLFPLRVWYNTCPLTRKRNACWRTKTEGIHPGIEFGNAKSSLFVRAAADRIKVHVA